MPARIVKQNREIKELFRKKIQEKIERQKREMHERINEEVPSWIRWAVRPLAEWRFNAVQARDEAKGEGGEDNAFLHFWLLLSNSWVIVNDVVLEPEPNEFAQIDHVLIGPPGIFLVETKAWEGAFLGYKDMWKRKEGNSWVRCESPTKQNLRHKRLFADWLKGLGSDLPGDLENNIFPVVLFTRCQWLKAEECSMPVFNNGAGLVGYLRRCAKEKATFSPDQIEQVAKALSDAKPLCMHFGVECMEKVEIQRGKKCIRVLGLEEKAALVREMYINRGRTVSRLFSDKREVGWWCFYVLPGQSQKKYC
ncbi:nuclease-related domain-containing protein [Moorella sulfitireducens (nom. illeg.)]|uniref:nuclease-related domain-containing protein n=1 Tax=Neomoorella sulfitireducens TaxID=2972948 RepID=UPI0021AC6ED4|nr:nuclease-related domain-containing protein [Moorella sulfitireducens]